MRTWEALTNIPLTVAAALFLAAYATPILWWPTPPALAGVCEWITWVSWALFALDYLVRLTLAEHRTAFVRRHILDLLAVALPLLRPLRLLRLATVLSTVNRRASARLRGRVVTYMVGASILLAFCGSLAALEAERATPGAIITSPATAAWWAISTMSTVGYGDVFPITDTGRLVAALLMVGGIAILGVVTASLASWLVEAVSDESDDLRAEVRQLRADVQILTDELRRTK